MYFADHIREIRIAAGLNQTEFAQSLDVDQQTVSRWERGISLGSLLILPTMVRGDCHCRRGVAGGVATHRDAPHAA